MRCFSTHNRAYWWPRRKCFVYVHHDTAGILNTHTIGRTYSTEIAESMFDAPHQDIPFLDGFPDRLIREGVPRRLKRKSIRRAFMFEDIWTTAVGENQASGDQDSREGSREKDRTTTDRSSPLEAEDISSGSSREASLSMHERSSTNLVVGDTIQKPLDGSALSPVKEEASDLAQPDITWRRIEILPGIPIVQSFDDSLRKHTAVSPAAEAPLVQEPMVQPIHVLGVGRLGKYVAHAVAGLSHAPPVTLLLHTQSLMKRWREEGRAIRVLRDGKLYVQDQVRVEYSGVDGRGFRGYQSRTPASNVIKNLIVTTDPNQTVPALNAVRHRLRSSSSILFLQDGMGIIDKVNEKVFPDSMARPNYALGNIGYQLTPTEKTFTIIEREVKGASLSVQLRSTESNTISSHERPVVRTLDGTWGPFMFLMRTLARSPELKVVALSRPDFLLNQLQNVAINSVIGPLSVLYDCSNSQLLNHSMILQTMRIVLKETSQILCSIPEISRVSGIHEKFSARKLEAVIVSVIKKTNDNPSVMLQDIKAGRRTSIDFNNGYLVRRATEMGIACPHNELLLAMVRAKQMMTDKRDEMYIPLRAEY